MSKRRKADAAEHRDATAWRQAVVDVRAHRDAVKTADDGGFRVTLGEAMAPTPATPPRSPLATDGGGR